MVPQNRPTKLDFFVAESWEKRVWEVQHFMATKSEPAESSKF
jgi:hypothetical protein